MLSDRGIVSDKQGYAVENTIRGSSLMRTPHIKTREEAELAGPEMRRIVKEAEDRKDPIFKQWPGR